MMQTAGGVAEADRQAKLDGLESAPAGLRREELVAAERPAPPSRCTPTCVGISR